MIAMAASASQERALARLLALVGGIAIPASLTFGIGSAWAQDAQPAAPAVSAHAPVDIANALSPMGMFYAADPVVKGVMIALCVASVLTWTMLFLMAGRLLLAQRKMRSANKALLQSATLAEFDTHAASEVGSHAIQLLSAARLEVALSDGLPAENMMERVKLAMTRVEHAINRRMTSGLGILAIIGSTGPFVGLFGTVWGIMHSFISIAQAQTTNLSVVAPGIAEALLATAIGLVAAIPAVIFYNLLTRQASAYRALVHDAESFILRHLSRDLDRRDLNAPPKTYMHVETVETTLNGERAETVSAIRTQVRSLK